MSALKLSKFIVLFLFFSFQLSSLLGQHAPDIMWDKIYGGSGSDSIAQIQQTTDGGYIVAGSSSSNDGDVSDGNNGYEDSWIIKLDASGNKEWDKTYGGSGWEVANSIQQTTDGGYIVAGSSSSNDGDVSDGNNGYTDSWIIKLDASGNKEWDKTYGGSSGEYATSIQQTTDGGYIVACYTRSNDGDVSDGNNGYTDYWIIKLEPETPTNTNQIEIQNIFSMYPNPANSQIVIATDLSQPSGEVLITDMTGKIVKQIKTQNLSTEVDISNLKKGVYFVKLGDMMERLVKK